MLAVRYSCGAAPVARVELAKLAQGLGKHAITTASRRGVASAAACCVSNELFYARAAFWFGGLEVLAVRYSRGAAPAARVELANKRAEGLGKHAITSVSRRDVASAAACCVSNEPFYARAAF